MCHFNTASHITTPLITAALSLPLQRIHTTNEQLTKEDISLRSSQKSKQYSSAGRTSSTRALPEPLPPSPQPRGPSATLSALPALLRSLQMPPAAPQCACAARRWLRGRRWRLAEVLRLEAGKGRG